MVAVALSSLYSETNHEPAVQVTMIMKKSLNSAKALVVVVVVWWHCLITDSAFLLGSVRLD